MWFLSVDVVISPGWVSVTHTLAPLSYVTRKNKLHHTCKFQCPVMDHLGKF